MTEIRIELDRKHDVIRSGERWAVRRRNPDGNYDLLEAWNGSRRSLMRFLEANGIVPSREAERRLAAIPESTRFRERT